MYLVLIRHFGSCANCTIVILTKSGTTASGVSNNLIEIITTHGPFWSTLSILTKLLLEKLWVLFVVSFLEAIVRNDSMAITTTK
jgi:hypothetical protein